MEDDTYSYGEITGRGGGGGENKTINTELWHACAGPLVSLPIAGTHVVYFPQGHSEQVLFPFRSVSSFLYWVHFLA